jgi:hypothetical protein
MFVVNDVTSCWAALAGEPAMNGYVVTSMGRPWWWHSVHPLASSSGAIVSWNPPGAGGWLGGSAPASLGPVAPPLRAPLVPEELPAPPAVAPELVGGAPTVLPLWSPLPLDVPSPRGSSVPPPDGISLHGTSAKRGHGSHWRL